MTNKNNTTHQAWLEKARKVFAIEISALHAQCEALDDSFIQAVQTILALQGRLVVVGMGKSGIIAKKIAATFASTGTPAFFVHAAEALHGDLGMITGQDAVLALSHSGETAEVCGLLPEIRRRGAHVIAMTGNQSSTLAKYADTVLHIDVQAEACPLNLAPTASTTATLALGDALAVVILKERGFREEDFARVHPAGSLGRKLLRVQDIMHQGKDLPIVSHQASLREAIMEISAHHLGITAITQEGQVIGCISDGDLRRILESGHMELDVPVHTLMHRNPMCIEAGRLASEAVRLMEENKVLVLFACDQDGQVKGIVHMHDILQGGIK